MHQCSSMIINYLKPRTGSFHQDIPWQDMEKTFTYRAIVLSPRDDLSTLSATTTTKPTTIVKPRTSTAGTSWSPTFLQPCPGLDTTYNPQSTAPNFILCSSATPNSAWVSRSLRTIQSGLVPGPGTPPKPALAFPHLTLCFLTPRVESHHFPTVWQTTQCGISAVKLYMFCHPKRLCLVAEWTCTYNHTLQACAAWEESW